MNPQYAEVSRILGQSESDRQLSLLSKALHEHLPGLKQNAEFDNAAKLWDRRGNTWSKQLETDLQQRKQPVYTQQDIAALNNAYNVMVGQVNKTREATMSHYNKLLDESRARKKTMEDCVTKTQHDSRSDSDSEICKQEHLAGLIRSGHPPPDAVQQMNESKLKVRFIRKRREDFLEQFTTTKENAISNELIIQERIRHVKYMTPSKGEKHWLLSNQDGLLGWVPHLDAYKPICTNKAPSTSDLAKLTESCPFTNTLNLALTIRNYIEYSDSVGWSDKLLMQALIMMLKIHRPDLHTKLNVKRSSFFSFFQALILTCGQNAEITACRDFLGKFTRVPGQSFTETITTFDSVYCHHQQLLRPITRKELQETAKSTLKQITPFLVSDKCSKLFTSWAEQQTLYQQPITKEKILDVIQRFEVQPELQLLDKRRLPHHLGFVDNEVVNVNTFRTLAQTEAKYEGSTQSSSRPTFSNRPRSSSRDKKPPYNQDGRNQNQSQNQQPSPNGRNPSQQNPDHSARGRSPSSTSSVPYQPTNRPPSAGHRPAAGGHIPRPGSRQGSHSRDSSRGSAYSTKSTESNPSQYRAVERHSSKSASSRRDEVKPIPSMYRSKSPGTVNTLKKHYFTPGDGHEELKQWREQKRCLRCFAQHHMAKDCPVHREAAPEPCRLCVFLFHSTRHCTRYTLDGRRKQIQGN